MPRSTYGTGTMLRGRDAPQSSPRESYIATEWITILWIPILPLGSFRVYPLWETGIGATRIEVQRVPMQWRQVMRGYAITLAIAIALLAMQLLRT